MSERRGWCRAFIEERSVSLTWVKSPFLSLPCPHVLFAGRQAGGRAFIEGWSFTSECFYLLFSPMHRGVAGFGLLLPVRWELSLRDQHLGW